MRVVEERASRGRKIIIELFNFFSIVIPDVDTWAQILYLYFGAKPSYDIVVLSAS